MSLTLAAYNLMVGRTMLVRGKDAVSCQCYSRVNRGGIEESHRRGRRKNTKNLDRMPMCADVFEGS